MLFSGLPPLVREQDAYRAGFTIRNASSEPLRMTAAAKLTPESAGKRSAEQELAPIELELAPSESRDVSWDAKAPLNADTLLWNVTVSAKRPDGTAVSDSMKAVQKVIPAVPVRTFQATIAQLDKPLVVPVAIPSDAIPGRGGVQVALVKSLAGELAGVHEYMSRYPYTCLEQLASQAVALRRRAQWDALDGRLACLPRSRWLREVLPHVAARQRCAHHVSVVHRGGSAAGKFRRPRACA